jgi:hypothetical protein
VTKLEMSTVRTIPLVLIFSMGLPPRWTKWRECQAKAGAVSMPTRPQRGGPMARRAASPRA